MDPITIIATATTAFNAIKKGIQIGKDIHGVSKDLGKFAEAISDLTFVENKIKNPPWYKSFSGSVEQEAIEIFAAKKKADAMRDELKNFISFSYGLSAWNELLAIEAQVRKERQEQIYKKQELKEKIVSVIIVILVLILGITKLSLITYLLWLYSGGLL